MVNTLNKAMMSFSKSLWRSATEGDHVAVRATYYESLWKKVTKKNSGKNYLDIGAGGLVNSVTFGKNFAKTYALDTSFSNDDISKAQSVLPSIQTAVGDAHKLPYADQMFDVVTMISVIEHLKIPEKALREAMRVLRINGELVVQIQNKYFPVETHTGLVFVYYLPGFFRKWLLRKLGYGFYFEMVSGFPTPREISKYLEDTANLKSIKEVILPVEIIPFKMQPIYKLVIKTGIVKVMPHSWLAVYTKR